MKIKIAFSIFLIIFVLSSCKKEQMATVSTADITEITTTSAKCGGDISDDGNSFVTQRGICWNASPNPTINNQYTSDGNGSGSYTSTLSGLVEGVTYYVRAYAINSMGTVYGEEKNFITGTTPPPPTNQPTVTTNTVSNISATSATCGGNVTSDGNSAVTTKGVCWSTSQNPTIANNKTNDGQGLGLFTSNITGLTSSTTYYVRAYATNSNGTSYGEQKSFKTTIHGMLNGVFSVSSTNKVCFSQGNLQYQASTNTWRFAANQYSIVGNAAGNTSPSATQSAWIDLFGWGTSGFNGKHPYNTSTNSSDYGTSGNGNISGTNYDWGVYNPISNGGNQSGMWHTLTQSEWYYLLFSRTNASDKYGLAKINGVPGLVILPDDWTLPNTCSFSAVKTSFDSNNYTLSQWNDMQTAGAVFLPAAGKRHLTTISSVGSYGYYWSTSYGNSGAYDLLFGTTSIHTWISTGVVWGESVRMVRNQ